MARDSTACIHAVVPLSVRFGSAKLSPLRQGIGSDRSIASMSALGPTAGCLILPKAQGKDVMRQKIPHFATIYKERHGQVGLNTLLACQK